MVRSDDWVLLLGRLLVGALFVPAGLFKLIGFSGTVGMLAAKGLPVPEIWAVLAILCEFGGALLVVIGFQTRLMALVMIIFTLFATFLVHTFWTMQGPEAMANQINFFKNLAICGGLLFLHVAGAGRLSWDGWRVGGGLTVRASA
jgi:putative oxidoreductase